MRTLPLPLVLIGLLLLLAALALAAWWMAHRVPVPPTAGGDGPGGEDLAREVRKYHIPDFTNWKDHDTFEAAFARLLRDLKAEGPPAAK